MRTITTHSKIWGLQLGLGSTCIAEYYVSEYQRGHYADGIWVDHNYDIRKTKKQILWVIDNGKSPLKVSNGGEIIKDYYEGIEIAGVKIFNMEKKQVTGYENFVYEITCEELPPIPIKTV